MHRRLLALCAAIALIASIGSDTAPLHAQTSGACSMLAWTGFNPGAGEPPLYEGGMENVDGTPVRALDGVTGVGWSPDGHSFAWSEQELGDGTLNIGDATASSADHTLPDAGGRHVSWSPAGGRVLVSDAAFGVHLVDDSGAVVDVWPDGRHASWSSDGAWITWTTGAGVFIARADGSAVQLVAGTPANHAIWRPGTHQLLILQPSLLIYDVDTGALAPFPLAPSNFASGYAWSPDGRALAWSASVDGVQAPRIFVERFDGNPAEAVSPSIPVTADPTAARPFRSPSWSPDGATIAAAEFDGVWMAALTMGHPAVRLFSSTGLTGGTPIGTPGQFSSDPFVEQILSMQWSPDSRWLLVLVEAGFIVGGFRTGYQVVVMPVDESIPPRLVGGSTREAAEMAWWPVLGVRGEGGACVLPAVEVEPEPEPGPAPVARPRFTG